MVFPFGSVVRGLSCIEDLSESLEDVRPLQRRCTEKAQEVREFVVKGEGTEERLGGVGCNGQEPDLVLGGGE